MSSLQSTVYAHVFAAAAFQVFVALFFYYIAWELSIQLPNQNWISWDEGWARFDFLKQFRSVLERGPSARSFCSCSFFFNRFVIVPFRPVSFRSKQKNSHPVLFRSWRSQSKNGSIPLVPFLVKNVSIPRSDLSKEQLHQRQKFYRKELVKK